MSTETRYLPPPIVALLAWLVPGAGYLAIGHRLRGLVVGLTILALFVGGMLIGGLRVAEPPVFSGEPGRWVGQLLSQRPWFIAQFLAGPISLVPRIVLSSSQLPISHARVNEIGTLYAAIAGMLNLLTIIDSAYRAGRGGPK